MKVEINQEKNEQEIKFPCIMISTDNEIIILVTKEEQIREAYVGACIYSTSNGGKIGDYSTSWAKHAFTPFTGTITLSND